MSVIRIRPLLTVVQKRASYGLADCGHVIRHSGYYHHTIDYNEAAIREQRLFLSSALARLLWSYCPK